MTHTFAELISSHKAREKAERFFPNEHDGGTHWMSVYGHLYSFETSPEVAFGPSPPAVWQGYLEEGEAPPEPEVFNRTFYFNAYHHTGVSPIGYESRASADHNASDTYHRVSCKRINLKVVEGQWDD